MLNLVQHLIKSRTYKTLKEAGTTRNRVQGDKSGLFTNSSIIYMEKFYNLLILKIKFK